jgi:hypothetical protein
MHEQNAWFSQNQRKTKRKHTQTHDTCVISFND